VPALIAVARRGPNRIRLLRQERGLQQKELAQLASIDRGQLNRYELGREIPGWRAAIALAGALGVGVADLGIEEQVRERLQAARPA
jgi:transcriptional regulator with XRE-family HTH domain